MYISEVVHVNVEDLEESKSSRHGIRLFREHGASVHDHD